jgi:hypothetical protein
MGTMAISVEGHPVFSWDGDEVTVQNVLREFPHIAERLGISVNDLAMSSLAGTSDGGLWKEPRVRDLQMKAIIWLILNSPTNHPDHPGKISDYAGTLIFNVDLRHRGGGCDVHFAVKGSSPQ